MDESDIFIDQRGQLQQLSGKIERLELVAEAFDTPLSAQELQPLSQLKDLLELSLMAFPFSPVDTLNAVHPDYVWKLELSNFPVLDSKLLTALSRFSNLSELRIGSPFETLAPADYDRHSSLNFPHLVCLEIGGNADFLEKFLNTLTSPKLAALTLTLDSLTPGIWTALTRFRELRSLSLYAQNLSLDVKEAAVLPLLHQLWVKTLDPQSYLPLRDLGVKQGLAKIVKTKGKIGGWYETGKELRTREFASNDGFCDNWPVALRPGQALTIFNEKGAPLFSGLLIPEPSGFEGTWTQKGIDPKLWELWFTSDLQAELETYTALPDRDFTIT